MTRKCLIFLLILLVPAIPLAAQDDTPTPNPNLIVTIWIPDNIYPLTDDRTEAILLDQIEGFNQSHTEYQVILRLKPSTGEGSILNTLMAGESVAPGAMPDLVLMRRNSLDRAAQLGIVRNIDNWVPDTLRGDLLPNVLDIGVINGILYGLPYAVVLQHTVYQNEVFETPPTSFELVLGSEEHFLFPGLPAPEQQVNDMVLAQYLQAGGRLQDDNGEPVLDEAPLRTVLNFYAEGLDTDIFGNDVITYDEVLDYWPQFIDGSVPFALVNSTLYLQQYKQLENVSAATIPTPDRDVLVLADGWMWALITADPQHQDAALAFIEWMMRPTQHARYTEAFGILPSQRPALRIWENEAFAGMVTSWLENSLVVPFEVRNNAAATQLQAAFVSVMNGALPSEAINTALENLGQP